MKFTDNSSFFPHLKKWSASALPGSLSSKLMSPLANVCLSCFQDFCLIFQSLTMMCFSTGFFSFVLFVWWDYIQSYLIKHIFTAQFFITGALHIMLWGPRDELQFLVLFTLESYGGNDLSALATVYSTLYKQCYSRTK